MAKLKTRTNQPVYDEEGLLDHIAQEGNTTQVGGNLYVDGNLEVGGELPASVIYKHTLIVSKEGVEYVYYLFTTTNKQYTNYSEFNLDINNIIACRLLSPSSADTYGALVYADGTGALAYYIDNLEVKSAPLPAPNADIVMDTINKI